jgi:hypothetical protein
MAADLFLIGWKGFPGMNTLAYFAPLSMTKKEKKFFNDVTRMTGMRNVFVV